MQNEENELKLDDLFIVRKEIVIAVYEQISLQNTYIQAYRKAVTKNLNEKRRSN
jgi:hypothetical protein